MELKSPSHMEENNIEKIMPWIGMYITAASVACVVAMAADAVIAIRSKRYWFPCKYFSLNATSVTLLAIASKLLVDLNTNVDHLSHASAKLASAAFVPSAVMYLLPSMGSMTNAEILTNSVALALLLITIVVNLWIPSILNNYYLHSYFARFFAPLMLLALAAVISSAIALPSIKRRLEPKYQDIYDIALKEEEHLQEINVNVIELMIEKMKKYMVASETSNPQFVMARSFIVSSASIAICLLTTIAFLYIGIKKFILMRKLPLRSGTGEYGVSTICICVVQFIGIMIASVVSAFRLFFSLIFNSLVLEEVVTIERLWIEDLLYWRDSFTTSPSQLGYFHKCLHNVKWLALTLCIVLHFLYVCISKIVAQLIALGIAMAPGAASISMTDLCRGIISAATSPESRSDNTLVNLSRFIVLLEGEGELPIRILKGISQYANSLIREGKKQEPKHLIHLLTKTENFQGVREFDNREVKSLLPQELPSSWSLPLVTLTSILIAFPNIPDHKTSVLLREVGEGLSLMKHIDEDLDVNGRIINVRRVADATWVGVAFYRKWQDIDLKRKSRECRNSKQALEELSLNAESIILKFKQEQEELSSGSPMNWPEEVISACSMYRITQTILLSCPGEEVQSDEKLFDKWCVVIAGILAAGLTTLQSLIMRMCHHNANEKREESVHKAFLVLGRTRKILEILLAREYAFKGCDYSTSIDAWRDISV